ncbi:hypothetical protein JRQ81_016173 [Phrynocephalus forsythii]|uniref:Uncharacterized protein n=1 Tax=Phrynocephalus forsythii TaxID=171643 RepID=A0A9Q0XX92_9SAUR|nr:hypothetical protein JRQ81_016173 [Phrynocephalus forsythii]
MEKQHPQKKKSVEGKRERKTNIQGKASSTLTRSHGGRKQWIKCSLTYLYNLPRRCSILTRKPQTPKCYIEIWTFLYISTISEISSGATTKTFFLLKEKQR